MNARERQFYNQLFKTIGIDPSSFKTPTAKQSPYFDAKGKRIPQKNINQYEIVYDSKGEELPNPQGRGLVDLIPASPRDLIVETFGAGIGEAVNNPEVGAVGGLLASILTGRPKPKQQVSNPYNSYSNPYNSYSSNPYQYTNYPVTVKNRGVAKPTELLDLSNPSIKKIVNQFKDDQVGRLPLTGLPRLESGGTIRGLDEVDVDWMLTDRYGKDAVPIFRQGDYKQFGEIRGIENLDNVRGHKQMMFGNIDVQMSDVDIENPAHFNKWVTAESQGEAWERAQRYVRDNPERRLSVDLTPGGIRFYDTSMAGITDKMKGESVNNYMKFMGALKTDPAYMNFELSRIADRLNKIYKGSPSKGKGQFGKSLLDFIAQKPYALDKSGAPLFAQENWIKMSGKNAPGYNPVMEEVDWDKIKGMPDYIQRRFIQTGGIQSAIRLSAKPQRISRWARSKSEAPYTSQWIGDIVGKESTQTLFPQSAMRDKANIIDQLRYVQGLQDPVRKDWGVGFGDSDLLDPVLSSFENTAQETIRKNLKLGLLPAIPTLGQEFNIEENR
tara:strand:- start:1809 stop:3470 length:1662 start_codon:yes stop_codon:yes gene_type:complete